MAADKVRIGRPNDPRAALGLAVATLMRAPAFASLPFGAWSRVLVGQVNRGHCVFAFAQDRAVGFAGWGLCSQETAERWLLDGRDPPSEECTAGNHVMLNAWLAESPNVSRALSRWLRASLGDRTLVARRFYADGRIRPVRLGRPRGS